MSNHYHVVLHINIAQAQGWSMDEVIKRWHRLYGVCGLKPSTCRHGKTPESSDHSRIKKRVQRILNIEQTDYIDPQPDCLYPFVGNLRENMPDGLSFKLEEYIELVDLTGRQMRGNLMRHPSQQNQISLTRHPSQQSRIIVY